MHVSIQWQNYTHRAARAFLLPPRNSSLYLFCRYIVGQDIGIEDVTDKTLEPLSLLAFGVRSNRQDPLHVASQKPVEQIAVR
jgi:hypothetical protein